jgi:hypothetical protein
MNILKKGVELAAYLDTFYLLPQLQNRNVYAFHRTGETGKRSIHPV